MLDRISSLDTKILSIKYIQTVINGLNEIDIYFLLRFGLAYVINDH